MRTIQKPDYLAAIQTIRLNRAEPLAQAYRVFLRYQAEELEEQLALVVASQDLQALVYQYQAVCRLLGAIEKPPVSPKTEI